MNAFTQTSKNYKVTVVENGELMLTDTRDGSRNSFLDAGSLLQELESIRRTTERHLLDMVEVGELATAILSKQGVQS